MAETNLKKSKQGYGYKYTELAQINDYLESKGIEYYQFTQTEEGNEFIYTVPIVEGKELQPRRGCRVIQAALSGKSNPAQEQGSAITYARRYSLLMAFGLATEDDDAASLDGKQAQPKQDPAQKDLGKVKAHLMKALTDNEIAPAFVFELYGVNSMDGMTEAKSQNALEHIEDLKAKYTEGKKKEAKK